MQKVPRTAKLGFKASPKFSQRHENIMILIVTLLSQSSFIQALSHCFPDFPKQFDVVHWTSKLQQSKFCLPLSPVSFKGHKSLGCKFRCSKMLIPSNAIKVQNTFSNLHLSSLKHSASLTGQVFPCSVSFSAVLAFQQS